MEVLGLCAICSKPARHTCSMCGRVVCSEHYVKRLHLCTNCARLHGDRERERPPDLKWMN
ncbi:MAG: hypothetical protein JXA45_06440 [Methanomassiliicoccales archaeon]|nr:hypothetical protein [Methanomassiliicoccales archaeon]